MISNFSGIEPDNIVCDIPVDVVFADVTETSTIPKFRPTGDVR